MQDFAEVYRNGVAPQLIELREAVPLIREGDADGIEAVRGVCHQLKGSGTSYGHPEITSLASAALRASNADLEDAVEALMAGLDEVVETAQVVKRIAVVDDDPLIRTILTRMLAAPGREFLSAGSLAEARTEVDETVDLVLLDLLLPDGDGRELLNDLQGDAETAHIPVVVMSGSDSKQIRAAALESGATAFLEKPFDAKNLSNLVDGLLVAGTTTSMVNSVDREKGRPAPDPTQTLSVLLAEDDDLVAALVADRLTRDGCEIRHYADGDSALADALKSPPDLAILDVMMPKMNGFEVLGRLRNDERTADVPVIILTGRGREEDVVRGFKLGASDYIVKPFSPAELAVRVRRHAKPS